MRGSDARNDDIVKDERISKQVTPIYISHCIHTSNALDMLIAY